MAETTDPMVAALLRERDGYLRAGKKDRAALVDEQLALRGHHVDDESDPRKEPPRKRQAPSKRTAD